MKMPNKSDFVRHNFTVILGRAVVVKHHLWSERELNPRVDYSKINFYMFITSLSSCARIY